MRSVTSFLASLLLAASCGPPGNVKVVISMMESDDPLSLRAGAAEARALAENDARGIEAAAPALFNVLLSDDQKWTLIESGEARSSHQDALIALERIPLEELLVFATSERFVERMGLMRLLQHLADPRGVETLIAAMDDEHDGIATVAMEALGRIGDPRAIPPLIARATSDPVTPDYDALRALGNFPDPRVKDVLVELLASVKTDLGLSGVLSALTQVGGDPRTIEPLLAMMDGKAFQDFTTYDAKSLEPADIEQLRTAVFRCLGAEGYKEPRVIEALIAVLDNPDDPMAFHVPDSLESLTGQKWGEEAEFGRDPNVWRRWWRDHQDEFE